MPRGLKTKPGGRLQQWFPEVTSAVTSIALLVTLVVVLASFNRDPVFDSRIITLNAIVSMLSTSSKATLLFAIASAISQWNWILFAGRPRPLYDFERVNDASRGPLGSLMLLWNFSFRGGALVRFGALIAVLTIALDPFAQQLVQLDGEMRFLADDNGVTAIPWASRYSQGNRFTVLARVTVGDDGRLVASSPQIVYADADFALQSATIFGTTANRSSIVQQLAFRCPSGECAFPPVASLTVCSQCADLTPHLERTTVGLGDQYYSLAKENGLARAHPNSTEYRLPNGLYLNNRDGESGGGEDMVYMTMLGTTNTSKTVAMGHVDTLIWSQSIIKVDGSPDSGNKWPDYGVHASECALYYCVRNYTSEVRNATLFETSSILEDQKRAPESWWMNRSKWEGISDEVVQSLAFNPSESVIERDDLQLGHMDGNSGWNLSQQAVNGVSAFMQKTFATCLKGANCTEVLDDWVPVNGFFIAGEVEQYEPSVAKALWDTKDFNGTFYNIAMSMSNAIRNGADNGETRSGLIGVPTTVYSVDWRWIALHCTTELGAVVFLFLTIWVTLKEKGGRIPVWKASELAVFSRGVVLSENLKDAETIEELGRKAKAISVVLVDGGGGTRPGDDQGLPLVNRRADQ